jgi:hypothetical protein
VDGDHQRSPPERREQQPGRSKQHDVDMNDIWSTVAPGLMEAFPDRNQLLLECAEGAG